MTFSLPIRFQQVPDPVPAKFTLSTQFLLLSERDQWLNTNPDEVDNLKVDAAFSKGKFEMFYQEIQFNFENDTIVNPFVNFIAIFANRLQDLRTHLVEGRKWFREGWQRICSGSSKGLLVYWCRGIYSYL